MSGFIGHSEETREELLCETFINAVKERGEREDQARYTLRVVCHAALYTPLHTHAIQPDREHSEPPVTLTLFLRCPYVSIIL